MSTPIGHCRTPSCQAPVYWLKNQQTGKMAPIDAAPSDKGNIAVDLADGTYQIIPAAAREAYQGRLHTNHFATCPAASKFRRK